MNDAKVVPSHQRLILILALMGGIGPFAIDTYLPALPGMTQSLGASPAALQMTISAYLLAVAFAPMITASLSDAYGRKPVLVAALGLFCITSVACATAPNADTLIALRVLQAVGGGTIMTVGRAILADLFQGDALSRAMSQMLLVFSIAPVVAPLVGGLLLEMGSWRYIFGFLAILGVLGLGLQTQLPETLPPPMRRRADLGGIAKQYWAVMCNADGRYYLVYTFLSGVFFFAMLASAPFLFVETYGFSEFGFAWVFAAISAAALPANLFNTSFVMRVGYDKMLTWSTLLLLGTGVVLILASALNLGGWIGLFIPLLCIMAAFHLMISNTVAGLMDVIGPHKGSGAAVIAMFRFSGGAVGAALVGAFGSVSQLGFAFLITATALAMLALIWRRST
ncbi:MAG: multidrug effflux MFS transporter [Pseudomonadota bacterium]